MDKLGRQERSTAAAGEVANANIARSARAIGVFIVCLLPWDELVSVRRLQRCERECEALAIKCVLFFVVIAAVDS